MNDETLLESMYIRTRRGRQFTDVIKLPVGKATLEFFQSSDRYRDMAYSELNHGHTALAGVIRDFEALPEVVKFFEQHDGHETRRFRHFVGDLIRFVMVELHGWHSTGRKGSLGVREKVAPHTTKPGAYYNKSGLSRWFTRSEHYTQRDPVIGASVAASRKAWEAKHKQ